LAADVGNEENKDLFDGDVVIFVIGRSFGIGSGMCCDGKEARTVRLSFQRLVWTLWANTTLDRNKRIAKNDAISRLGEGVRN